MEKAGWFNIAKQSSVHVYVFMYKLGVLMYRCQHNQAPWYLTDHCTPVSDTVFRQRLHSASSHQVSIPRYRLSTYGRRAFSVAGPTVWNSLPEYAGSRVSCGQLQTVTEDIFCGTSVFSAFEVCCENAPYKFTVDIDFTLCPTFALLFRYNAD